MTTASNLVIIFVSLIVPNEASRILAVFPAPSISHQVVFRPIVLELVKRGHEVVVLTPDPIFKKGEGPPNLTELDVHDMSYKTIKEEFQMKTVMQGSKEDMFGQWENGFKSMKKLVETQLSTNQMQALLKDKTKSFDLLLVEALFPILLGLTSVFNAPIIQISSFGPTTDNLRTIGTQTHPLIYPSLFQQRVYGMTFWEKIAELYTYYRMESLYALYEKDSEEVMKRIFGKDVPTLNELRDKVDMLFLNLHPIWESNRPVPPNVVYMGGLHQNPEKKLPKDLQKYLDSSEHGVIYVSFGTNVDPATLSPEKIQALIEAFSKTPHDILWKWNTDELPGKTENIRISKWLPQSDLLKHPKIKLFITQGGLQSTDEAITAGVPLIGMPMLGDQWLNVDRYVHHKIGLRVDMDTVTEESVATAIRTILNDGSYRENIVNLRSVMRDQPQTPLERATWWVEYVLRHRGAKHLRTPAANMPWTEYLEIELVSYVLLSLLLVVGVVGFAGFQLFGIFKEFQRRGAKSKTS